MNDDDYYEIIMTTKAAMTTMTRMLVQLGLQAKCTPAKTKLRQHGPPQRHHSAYSKLQSLCACKKSTKHRAQNLKRAGGFDTRAVNLYTFNRLHNIAALASTGAPVSGSAAA